MTLSLGRASYERGCYSSRFGILCMHGKSNFRSGTIMSVQQISRGVDMCEPYTKKSIVPNTGCALCKYYFCCNIKLHFKKPRYERSTFLHESRFFPRFFFHRGFSLRHPFQMNHIDTLYFAVGLHYYMRLLLNLLLEQHYPYSHAQCTLSLCVVGKSPEIMMRAKIFRKVIP